jgi:pimeloyl-ACP methyl ester carboxylesterase
MKTVAKISGTYVDVRGVRTYVERCGTGQSVLCLHTAGRDSRQWHWLMQELASDFELVAFDYPGHGKSWPLPGNRCIEDAEQLCDFIWGVGQAAGLRRPVITGCSVGGNLTLMMGARHSAELRAIVPMQGADFTPSISRAALDLMDHPHVSLPHFNREQSTSLAGRAALPEAYDLVEWTAFQLSGKTLGADLKIYTAIDIRDRMANIRCPVLMIRGEDDWLVSQAMVDDTVGRLVNARPIEVLRLPGIGHYAPMEAPEAVGSAIRKFMAKLPSG